MKTARRMLEPSGLALVEEAVHLLRRAPASTLALYYAGAVPFALGLLFFWAHTTWFQPSGEEVAWGALGLVGLFGVMKATQVEFCARLMTARIGAPVAPWSWRRLVRTGAAQLRVQPWALLGLGIAALFMVPVGWVYAYAQNLVVCGEDERPHTEAMAQTKLWPAQNHLGLLMISVLSLAVWVNLASAFFLVPWLANRLLGIDNIFGFSGWWFFNTTFLASVTALTWLAVDPLVKAYYVLRVFHGRTRRTGEDVRVELQLARRVPGAVRVAAAIAVLGIVFPSGRLRAGDAPNPTPANRVVVQPEPLDRAIEQVLAGPEFQWRLRPPPGAATKAAEGPIARFVRQGIDMVREAFRAVGRWIRRVVDWLERHLTRDRVTGEKAGMGGGVPFVRTLLYAFIGVAVLLILWVIWLIVRRARQSAGPLVMAQAVTAVAPDLRDENVQAAQLPVDGWLALAREQAARGEWRLALRALYLATLARLADDGLVSLAKFKTNLDYEREVRRRALSRTENAVAFSGRRREFEAVWYGRTEPAETQVRAWMTELERAGAR